MEEDDVFVVVVGEEEVVDVTDFVKVAIFATVVVVVGGGDDFVPVKFLLANFSTIPVGFIENNDGDDATFVVVVAVDGVGVLALSFPVVLSLMFGRFKIGNLSKMTVRDVLLAVDVV